MKNSEYAWLFQFGRPTHIMQSLRKDFDVKLDLTIVDRKIHARRKTPPPPPPKGKPKFLFTDRFFVRLEMMPSIEIEIVDSRSKIRREYYGYRDKASGERFYLKMDGDSVILIKDSPAGFIIGNRFYIPRMELMYKPTTWAKVLKLMKRVLNEQKIEVRRRDVILYRRRHRRRWRIVDLLIARRIFVLNVRSGKIKCAPGMYERMLLNEKTIKPVSVDGRELRFHGAGNTPRPKLE